MIIIVLFTGLFLGLVIGIPVGAALVIWQQELEHRDRYLPETWTPR